AGFPGLHRQGIRVRAIFATELRPGDVDLLGGGDSPVGRRDDRAVADDQRALAGADRARGAPLAAGGQVAASRRQVGGVGRGGGRASMSAGADRPKLPNLGWPVPVVGLAAIAVADELDRGFSPLGVRQPAAVWVLVAVSWVLLWTAAGDLRCGR